jgi:glutamate decarboxylase
MELNIQGAFDPIRKISEVAKKFNCWLHVDGSWGGSVAFSDNVMKNKDWLDGSELADTFTMNPHKLLGVPLQCSMLLTPHDGHLLFARANSLKADYLFHGNPYDLGAGTVGCGRRPDAAKIFLAWKFYGREGLGRRVDRALASAADFTRLVRDRKERGFILFKDPSPFLQICFWFIPLCLTKRVEEWIKKGEYMKNVSIITKKLHQSINQHGQFLVDHSPITGQPDFFRVVVNSPTVNLHRDLEQLLENIEEVSCSIDWALVLSSE